MVAAAPPPVLSFTAPANNAVLTSSTVTVAYTSSGDLSQAAHAHLILDGAEVATADDAATSSDSAAGSGKEPSAPDAPSAPSEPSSPGPTRKSTPAGPVTIPGG